MKTAATSLPVADWLHTASGPWQGPTLLLAALLVLMALLALALLWHVRKQRGMLRRAGHYLAVERDLRGVATHVPVAIFMLRMAPDGILRLDPLAGDLAAVAGLEPAALPSGGNPLQAPSFRERVHPEDLLPLSQLLELSPQADPPTPSRMLDFRVRAPEGMRWLHLELAAQTLADGGVQWIGCLFDASRSRAHDEALRAARDAAERAAKARADFLATMSHEIRTPMNGVIGMLELLQQTPLDAAQGELLHAVEDSASVLLQILNDVLDFSKLEAGSLRLDRAPFDPRTLVDNVVGVMAASMRRKGLQVDVLVDAATAGLLLGDGVRIRQILLNLLGNAAKFTERGRIAVAWRVLGDDGGTQLLRITVSDTGIGIPEEKQAALFTPFSQAEDWTAHRYGGTGLGLAISRHLVQLMDGEIGLASRPGEGTTVTLQLRLPVARREPEGLSGAAPRHALVRLRETGTAAALAEHLAALGLTVERIDPTLPLRTGMAADLLFLDEDDRDSGHAIPARVVAITMRDEPAAAVATDDECILLAANPLRWQALLRACTQALAPRHASGAPSTEETPGPPRSVVASKRARRRTQRILVAEDHPVGQQLMQRQLELLGWPFDMVSNGHAALAALQRGGYALLLTDCNMPRMSGYELATAWRQREHAGSASARLPIVATTANALAGELVRCREAGMDDCLSKPLQLEPLERKLEQWLDGGDSDTTDAAGAGAQASSLPSGSDDTGADIAPDTWRRQLLPMLIATSRDDLDELSVAIARNDSESAWQRLHRLLGALPLVLDDPLIEEGRQRLESLRAGENATLPGLASYVDAMRQLLNRVEQTNV
ncbi:ATP-binding protein [Dyella agri]|uniref:histidine kinase n=1 Tax=Dyella agri TaxID=1926869 RepID=A0ABW8KKT5_9GAMM